MPEFLTIANHIRFDHFPQQVIPFTSALSHSCKYAHTGICLGNIINQLHNDYGFANTGTAKEPDLTTFRIGFNHIDDLDSCIENFRMSCQVFEPWRMSMNGITIIIAYLADTIYGLPHHIKQSSLDFLANGHLDIAPVSTHFIPLFN